MNPMRDNYCYLYGPLMERSLVNFQVQHLARDYDFGKQSRVAALIVGEVNFRMGEVERRLGVQRIRPFHLYLRWRGVDLELPLFRPEYLEPIFDRSGDFGVSRERVLAGCLKIADREGAEISPTQLRGIIDPYCFVRYRRRGRFREGPHSQDMIGKGDATAVVRREIEAIKPLLPFERIDTLDRGAPIPLVNELSRFVEQEAGQGPTVANHMVQELITLRNVCCPRVRHLKTGEIPFLATSVHAHLSEEVAARFRRLTPVILTVWTKEELENPPWVEAITDELQKKRIIRVCFEAYRQNGLLSLMDLQWIFQISSRKLSELIQSAEKEYNIIVPTPGTILDSGRSMTHKDIVIDLYLQGYTVREVSHITFHSPRSVDNYINTFESVLILYLYGVPKKLMARILQKGISLIEEHLEIVKQHFKSDEEAKSLLEMKEVLL
jgi:hypothetical protein